MTVQGVQVIVVVYGAVRQRGACLEGGGGKIIKM